MPPAATGATGKTDAKYAYVIADQARTRRDLQPLQEWDETVMDLKILTARRYDLAADRARAINRMRAQLLEYFPALEETFEYAVSAPPLPTCFGWWGTVLEGVSPMPSASSSVRRIAATVLAAGAVVSAAALPASAADGDRYHQQRPRVEISRVQADSTGRADR
ncbi:IS110 family transposase [Streptomyces kutzneri]|uniref:IS110 family transposase n=1 Tax=Streptomyces kutzneri TaxID=3051179 RepID=UPI003F9D2680